ncbi:hypothetical protein BOVAC1_935 [Bacteroides ovatus]|nr:hypothetical protein BOVAC1_935 [Bacteroides ovatus]
MLPGSKNIQPDGYYQMKSPFLTGTLSVDKDRLQAVLYEKSRSFLS